MGYKRKRKTIKKWKYLGAGGTSIKKDNSGLVYK